MTYNLTLNNDDAKPIPYAIQVGDKLIRVDTLIKDHPLRCNVICIQGTPAQQIRVHCVASDIIIEPSPMLSIIPELHDLESKPSDSKTPEVS